MAHDGTVEPDPPGPAGDVDRARLAGRIPVLAALPLSAWDTLRPALRMVTLAPGEVLLEQGTDADSMFAVYSGQLETVLHRDGSEQALGRHGPGDVIGEVAVVAGGERTATVRAVVPTEVVEIPGSVLPALTAHAEVAAELARQTARRVRRSDLLARMAEVFGTTDTDLLDELDRRMVRVALGAGEVLYRKDDPADAAYLVVRGRLRCVDADTVVTVGRGDIVGETELMDRSSRHATVRAVRDSDLARLSADVFDDMLARHPAMTLEVARTVVRHRRRPERRPEAALTVAVVPARPGVDVGPITAGLTAAFAGFGSAARLGSARLDALAGRPGAARAGFDEPVDLHISHVLERAERETRFIVYEADPGWTTWSGRCVRQADRIVVVADGTAPADDRVDPTVASAVVGRGDDTTLVLLQPSDLVQPGGTRLDDVACSVADHHHVRIGSTADVHRLARALMGRGVTLALSGGGARGFAHLGVIRALGERAVPVDMVVGSSMGAIMAALTAMDLPHAKALEEARRRFKGLLDYTLPVVSLLRGRRIVRSLENTFGDAWIEDLWLPFSCVSTNLTRSRQVVHRRGPLVPALRASVAIPGVLPPVPHDGDLLVDGSVLDNLPLPAARSLNPTGTVIAVDVASGPGPRTDKDYGLSVSGWGALRHRGDHPRFVATMVRATLAGALRDRARMVDAGLADLWLDLDVHGVGLLEFDAVDRAASMGYEAAGPQLDAWLQDLAPRPWEPFAASTTRPGPSAAASGPSPHP